jgi:hypothetical protein
MGIRERFCSVDVFLLLTVDTPHPLAASVSYGGLRGCIGVPADGRARVMQAPDVSGFEPIVPRWPFKCPAGKQKGVLLLSCLLVKKTGQGLFRRFGRADGGWW